MQGPDDDEFKFYENESMAGIFSSGAGGGLPSFNLLRPEPGLNLPSPTFFDIPTPFMILSASAGLVLVRDLVTQRYHVLNPFVHDREASYRQIPYPYRTHRHGPPTVLSVDTAANVFHIICAMERKHPGHYTFDTFSSDVNLWFCDQKTLKLDKKRRIVANTGVSNGQGMAFWLTEQPQSVVMFKIEGYFWRELPLPIWVKPGASLQLGRVNEGRVGIVAATRDSVALFIIQLNYSWELFGFLKVKRVSVAEAAKGKMKVAYLDDPVATVREPQEVPELLRFEKEVPLWINGRMVVWEVNWENLSRPRLRVHPMPTWERVPAAAVSDSVPYAYTGLVGANFPAEEMDYFQFADVLPQHKDDEGELPELPKVLQHIIEEEGEGEGEEDDGDDQ